MFVPKRRLRRENNTRYRFVTGGNKCRSMANSWRCLPRGVEFVSRLKGWKMEVSLGFDKAEGFLRRPFSSGVDQAKSYETHFSFTLSRDTRKRHKRQIQRFLAKHAHACHILFWNLSFLSVWILFRSSSAFLSAYLLTANMWICLFASVYAFEVYDTYRNVAISI